LGGAEKKRKKTIKKKIGGKKAGETKNSIIEESKGGFKPRKMIKRKA